jgi:hypothetical protein
VQPQRIAKPLVHQLFIGRLNGRANDENNIVQFGVAPLRPSAEIYREKFVIHGQRPVCMVWDFPTKRIYRISCHIVNSVATFSPLLRVMAEKILPIWQYIVRVPDMATIHNHAQEVANFAGLRLQEIREPRSWALHVRAK